MVKFERLAREIAKAGFRALGYYPFTRFGVRYKMDPHHIWFWRWVQKNKWEPETYRILEHYLNADTIYCDIGSWIGPTSVVYAAHTCKHVICFEPDPVAYRYLQWNIELNQITNISSFNIALSDEAGVQTMKPVHGVVGDSTSSLIHQDNAAVGVDVVVLTWEGFIASSRFDRIDFIKIDIEGGEFSLIPVLASYLQKYRPIVYLSTHGPYLERGSRRQEMQKIVDVMQMYTHCLDQQLQPVGVDALLGKSGLNQFNAYVFTDVIGQS